MLSSDTSLGTPRSHRSRRLGTLAVFALGFAIGFVGLRMTDGPARVDDAADTALAAARSTSGPATTFRIASLNVLGDGHTRPGGNRRGWAPGTQRMAWQVETLRAEGVEVVGFQELQKAQYDTFTAMTANEYTMWPGNIDGRGFLRNSIAWKSSSFTLLKTSWVKLPYFNGEQLRMPVVLLQHNVTGQQAYFINFQNPANAHGDASRWRAQGRSLQINLVNRLRATTGLPVVWTGDLNDREKAFCDITRRSPMVSASGGTNVNGRCLPTTPMAVDWIFATSETSFSDYSLDRRPKIRKSTDHPLVLATATFPPDLAPICPVDPADPEPTQAPTP